MPEQIEETNATSAFGITTPPRRKYVRAPHFFHCFLAKLCYPFLDTNDDWTPFSKRLIAASDQCLASGSKQVPHHVPGTARGPSPPSHLQRPTLSCCNGFSFNLRTAFLSAIELNPNHVVAVLHRCSYFGLF